MSFYQTLLNMKYVRLRSMLNPLTPSRPRSSRYTVSVLTDPSRGLRRIAPPIDQYKNLKNQEYPENSYQHEEIRMLKGKLSYVGEGATQNILCEIMKN